MKTKTLITAIFVFTIIVNTNIFSQTYHPFLNHSSWLTFGGTGCCLPGVEKTIEQGTEEIIGGKTYTKFIDPWSVYGDPTVYLREDLTERKVFRLVNGSEVVLYDFKLENSNTIFVDGDTFTATIDAISINGELRKRITLKSSQIHCGQPFTQVWIEGIGNPSHPLDPGWNMDGAVCSSQGGFFINTVCTFQNGVHIYGNPNCSQYHSLLNNSWIVYQTRSDYVSPDTTITAGTDEVADNGGIVKNVTYKKFLDPFNNNAPVYLRENITEQTVYILVNGSEKQLYNFSYKTGDQIGINGIDFTATVDLIDINGGTRKRITWKSSPSELFCNNSVTQVWIEGIGSTSHPFDPGYNMDADGCGGGLRTFTKCVFQNDIHIYGPAECTEKLSVENFQTDNIQLFPNPANDMVYINFQNSTQSLQSIAVYDLLGHLAQKVSGISATQAGFSVGSLAKGMYMVEITTENMKTTKKLIVN